jgi:hypothetical protein
VKAACTLEAANVVDPAKLAVNEYNPGRWVRVTERVATPDESVVACQVVWPLASDSTNETGAPAIGVPLADVRVARGET